MGDRLDRNIGKYISILYRHFQIYLNKALKKYNLNSSEYIFLINIGQYEAPSQKMLADHIIIDQALATRVMKSLEKKGFITRIKNDQDKREKIVYLTKQGEILLPFIFEKLNYWTDLLETPLRAGELDQLSEQLWAISNHALKETRGETGQINTPQDRNIGKSISILYRHFQIYINKALKKYDLNASEYIFLINIDNQKAPSQKSLADQIIIDQALATRAMKSLEHKGFISRQKNIKDKREKIISLTEKGKIIQPVIFEKLQYWGGILEKGFTEDENTQLFDHLKKISENALIETKNN